MTDRKPDMLQDGTGKWAKREWLVQDILEEMDVSRDAVEEQVDEMIASDEFSMKSKMVGDTEYVTLGSRLSAKKHLLKYRTKSVAEKGVEAVIGDVSRFR